MPIRTPVALHADRAHVGQQHHGELPHLAVEPGSRELLAGNRISGTQDAQAISVHRTDDADRQPRPGEGVPPHDLGRQAELQADLADLVLEEGAQRLHQRESQVVRQASDVVVALDVGGAGAPARLHDVGIERALHEEVDGLALLAGLRNDTARGLLEDPDELAADDLALLLRILDSRQRGQEALLRIDDDEAYAGGRDEVALDLLGLACAQQPVIDEDAGELITHGALHERCGDRGVHAAGEAADHQPIAHLLADAPNLLLDDAGCRPRGLAPGDVVQEALEDALTVLGVDDLGVELHAREAALAVFERRDRGAGRLRGDREALGGRGDGVAVRHPDRLLAGQVAEEAAVTGADGQGRAAELAEARALDRAAERLRHRLEAVADAEDRHPRAKQCRIDTWCAFGVHARWSAGEDDRDGIAREHFGHGHRVGDDLGVHARLAHAAGDQLGVLRTEVHDQDRSRRLAHMSSVVTRGRRPGRGSTSRPPPSRAPG